MIMTLYDIIILYPDYNITSPGHDICRLIEIGVWGYRLQLINKHICLSYLLLLFIIT